MIEPKPRSLPDDSEFDDEEELGPGISTGMGHVFRGEGYNQVIGDAMTAEDGACFEKDGVIVRINPSEQSDSGMEISISEPITMRSKLASTLGCKPQELVKIIRKHGIYELGKRLGKNDSGEMVYELKWLHFDLSKSMQDGHNRAKDTPSAVAHKYAEYKAKQRSGNKGKSK